MHVLEILDFADLLLHAVAAGVGWTVVHHVRQGLTSTMAGQITIHADPVYITSLARVVVIMGVCRVLLLISTSDAIKWLFAFEFDFGFDVHLSALNCHT